MRHLAASGTVLLATALIGCGGSGGGPGSSATVPDRTAPFAASASPPAPVSSAASGGTAAAKGEMVLEVDGRTFTAPITQCHIDENNFIVAAKDPASGLAIEARVFNVGAGWTVSASVTEGSLAYTGVSTDDEPAIDGRSLSVTLEFGRHTDELPVEVGSGHVSATCDDAAP